MGGKHMRMCGRRHSGRKPVRIRPRPPRSELVPLRSTSIVFRQPEREGLSNATWGGALTYGTVAQLAREAGRSTRRVAGSSPACSASGALGARAASPFLQGVGLWFLFISTAGR